MLDGGLRQIFRSHIPGAHWASIETGGTGRGVPDSNYCLEGREGWIEYKQTSGWAVTLRPEQVAWISQRTRHGGRVLIAVRRSTAAGPRRGPAADQLWVLDGGAVVEIFSRGLVESEVWCLGMWDGGPSSWNWGRVVTLMKAG